MITESDSGYSGSHSHEHASRSARQRFAAEYVDSKPDRPGKAQKASEPDVLDFSADPNDATAGGAEPGGTNAISEEEEIRLIKSEWRRSLGNARSVEVEKEREAFDQALSGLSPSPEQAERIEKNIEEMKARLRQRGIPERELGLSLKQATRLLKAESLAVPESERLNLVEQIFRHGRSQESIDQGLFGTCGLATIEKHMFALMPSKAAEIVATTAITGGFQRPGGKRITIDSDSLQPDHEAANNNPPRNGSRDFASQLFSLAVANDYWQQQQTPRQYKLVDDGSGRKVEQLIDSSGNLISNHPNLDDSQLIKEAELLMQADYPLLVGRDPKSLSMQIDSPERLGTMLSRLEQSGELPVNLVVPSGNRVLNTNSVSIYQINGFDGSDSTRQTVLLKDSKGEVRKVKLGDLVRSMPGLSLSEYNDPSRADASYYGFDGTHPEWSREEPLYFFSADEMRDQLVSAIDKGNWPVTLKVNAADPLFRSAVDPSASDFTHVLSVTAYRETGTELEFHVDNQWGAQNDRWIKVSELYRATSTG